MDKKLCLFVLSLVAWSMAQTPAQTAINKAYCWLLGRCADTGGMTAFTNLYNTDGNQMLPICRALATSNEFYTKFISTYLTGPVPGLYMRLLGRAPDTGGLNYWNSILPQGWAAVANGICNSTEFYTKMNGNTSATATMSCVCLG